MNIAVLIPAFEPNTRLCDVVRECMALGLSRVIVVDDGSSDRCAPVFDEVAGLGAHVLRHEKNRGKGAALKTGITELVGRFPDTAGVVTADADGQHSPEDILRVAKEVENTPEGVVLGSRNLSDESVPARSRAGNRASAILFFLMTGVRCDDTQTGLRGISRGMFDMALHTPGDRYDFEMNFLVEIARKKLPIAKVPIQTIYFDNNSASHFRTVRDSALIYQRPLKYVAVSIGSSIVDLAMFGILSAFVFGSTVSGIWLSTALARCASGLFNFRLNQIWSFRPKRRTAAQFGKYLALFVASMTVSSLLVNLFKSLPLPLTLIKAFVDTALFFVNYQAQRRWVFADNG